MNCLNQLHGRRFLTPLLIPSAHWELRSRYGGEKPRHCSFFFDGLMMNSSFTYRGVGVRKYYINTENSQQIIVVRRSSRLSATQIAGTVYAFLFLSAGRDSSGPRREVVDRNPKNSSKTASLLIILRKTRKIGPLQSSDHANHLERVWIKVASALHACTDTTLWFLPVSDQF